MGAIILGNFSLSVLYSEFLAERKRQMTASQEVWRQELKAKGVPGSIADAMVHKLIDFNRSRFMYLEMRQYVRAREYQVQVTAAAKGVTLTNPSEALLHQYNK